MTEVENLREILSRVRPYVVSGCADDACTCHLCDIAAHLRLRIDTALSKGKE